MERRLKIIAPILVILTMLWVVLTTVSLSGIDRTWSNSEYVIWVAYPDIFYTANYVNVTILTILVVAFFSFMYHYLKEEYRRRAVAGLIFVFIYGIINVICYSIQISLVPSIARTALENPDSMLLASELIQANSHSLIGFLNGLAYAILGIPSIIFGVLLIRKTKKYSGLFLLLSGISSIVGLAGYILNNTVIALGIMVGGILFLLSLIFISIEFKSQS